MRSTDLKLLLAHRAFQSLQLCCPTLWSMSEVGTQSSREHFLALGLQGTSSPRKTALLAGEAGPGLNSPTDSIHLRPAQDRATAWWWPPETWRTYGLGEWRIGSLGPWGENTNSWDAHPLKPASSPLPIPPALPAAPRHHLLPFLGHTLTEHLLYA